MRVRRVAVLGAALVGLFASGTGIASATDEGEHTLPIPSCGELPYTLTDTEGGQPPCSTVDVWVDVDGDCADPETFTFYVDAEGLTAGTEYRITFTSDAFVADDGSEVEADFYFTADKDGNATESYDLQEGDGVEVTSGAFTVDYDVYDDEAESRVDEGYVDVAECETTPPTTTPPTTEPTVPTTAPVTTAPATTVAPVVVTHPAVAQPAVLANTGTPVAAAALLGGGLLVAGAGALVATRRRAS